MASSGEGLRALVVEAVREYTNEQKANIGAIKIYNNGVDFTSLSENPISLKTMLEDLGISNVARMYLYCYDTDTCGDAFEDFYDFDDVQVIESGSRRLMDDYSPASTLHKQYGNLRK